MPPQIRLTPRVSRSRFGFGSFSFPFNRAYQSNEQIGNSLLGLFSGSVGPQLLKENYLPSGIAISMTAGEALIYGDVVYIDTANTVKKATNVNTIKWRVIGVALQTAALGKSVMVQTSGAVEVVAFALISVGDLVTPASTAGQIDRLVRTHKHPIVEHGTHSHTQGSTGSDSHSHTVQDTGMANLAHSHTVGDTTGVSGLGHSHLQQATNSGNGGPHTHTQGISISNSDTHTHTNPSTGSGLGSHDHSNSGTGSDNHNHSNPTTAVNGLGGTATKHGDSGDGYSEPEDADDIIVGSVLGKAITGATAGNKCIILIMLG